MTIMMTEPVTVPVDPAEERRGGTRPAWTETKPGEELPEKDDGEKWDPPPDTEDCDMGYRAERGLPLMGSCQRADCYDV